MSERKRNGFKCATAEVVAECEDGAVAEAVADALNCYRDFARGP